MTEPYLILHKVRGEPAFDIAVKLTANPGELGHSFPERADPEEIWIIPTSGHRAYPYASAPLTDLHFVYEGGIINTIKDMLAVPPPEDCPDHYNATNDLLTRKPRPALARATKTDDFLI